MGTRDAERLRRLEAVTDATLSRLDASDLLDELLDRVRDLLDADPAAILLLDGDFGAVVAPAAATPPLASPARQRAATAAKGLKDEVRQGFRVPVGSGFAGRVAEIRGP